MLLNLVSASGSNDKDTLWGFIEKYIDGISAVSNPGLDKAADYAITAGYKETYNILTTK